MLERGDTISYAGKKFENKTAYQIALCEGDEVMAEKMRDNYLVANPENGPAILEAQFNEVFPRGYAAHLEEQKQSADEFEQNYLNPLIEAFEKATMDDLQAALEKRATNSELCQKLKEFRAAFEALSQRENVYNPNHLLKLFDNQKVEWWRTKFGGNHGLYLDLFWRQVIGWEERFMPANYAQACKWESS